MHARVAIIGGGVVGCSVLYHLTKRGWHDVVLLERAELTAGSTWHAAGGMHTFNGDPNVAALQKYTIELYAELERIEGTSCGVHRPGCLYLASTAREVDFFRSERSKARHLGLELDFIDLAEARRLNPLLDTSHFTAAMFDPNDGHVDPSGVTHALAKGAKDRGAQVFRHRPVTTIRQRATGEWELDTPQGTICAEYVVNAGGLWAREVGRMLGAELPIAPLEHQFILTNDIPELASLGFEIPVGVDFHGASYFRQERQGLLLGTYEQDCRHWALQGTPSDFGMELIAPDLDRISGELEAATLRIPALANAGIKRIVNGAMVFSPDGNPIVGPMPDLPTAFVAAGCMAGFSQGGAIGLVVANWIVDGEPGMDASAMDIARYGSFANREYVLAKTAENYRRRFIIPCPNEQLKAARPWKTSEIHARLQEKGALFGQIDGWEVPLWFAGTAGRAHETPTFRRSNAFDCVGKEYEAIRGAAGLFDTSSYCRMEVRGPTVANWLENIVAGSVPEVARSGACLMLTGQGRILGDFMAMRLDVDRFLLVSAPSSESIFIRWLRSHAPQGMDIRSVSSEWSGLSLSGPGADAILGTARGISRDLPQPGYLQRAHLGDGDVIIARSGSGQDTTFELTMSREQQAACYDRLQNSGSRLGLRDIGTRALNCVRLEQGQGAWGRELTQDFTPAEARLESLVDLGKPEFIGKDALIEFLPSRTRRLALLRIETTEADPSGGEAVLLEGCAIARLTSGAHSYRLGAGLGLAFLPAQASASASLEVEILGERHRAQVLTTPPASTTPK